MGMHFKEERPDGKFTCLPEENILLVNLSFQIIKHEEVFIAVEVA